MKGCVCALKGEPQSVACVRENALSGIAEGEGHAA